MTTRTLLIPYGKDLSPGHVSAIRKAGSQFRIILRPASSRLSALARDTEVMVTHRWPGIAVSQCAALRWVHSTSSGVDRLPLVGLGSRRIRVTNSGAAYGRAVAEHAITLLLGLAKGMGYNGSAQDLRAWKWHSVRLIQGRVLGVVGAGHIGREVASLGRALGMQVLTAANPAHRRSRTPTFQTILAQSDYVILAVPMTSSTRHLINERALAACRPSACVINVSRGDVVDEQALVKALRHGNLRGAALDVFSDEPYPPNGTLFTLPQVVATPHVAGSAAECMDRAVELLCDNLLRYVNGRPLRGRISLRLGY